MAIFLVLTSSLNTSINKKPISLSEVVPYKKVRWIELCFKARLMP